MKNIYKYLSGALLMVALLIYAGKFIGVERLLLTQITTLDCEKCNGEGSCCEKICKNAENPGNCIGACKRDDCENVNTYITQTTPLSFN